MKNQSNHNLTDLSLSIDPDAIIFLVGWHAIVRTTSREKRKKDKNIYMNSLKFIVK